MRPLTNTRRTKTVGDMYEVIRAFKEGREMRSKRVSLGRKRHYSWIQNYREGTRDQVKREDGVLTYYLWGSPIAAIDGNILTFDNYGYETQLTADRLQRILCAISANSNVPVPVCSCGKGGWKLAVWHARHEPYPLKINLRTGELLTKPDLDKQYRHLSQMRAPKKIWTLYDALKKFGPIPPEYEDKVLRKLMVMRLTEAA